MTSPTTAAGRALLERVFAADFDGTDPVLIRSQIYNIEQEAVRDYQEHWDDREPNHYDRFTQREAAEFLSPEGLAETRRKFTEALTDFYVHDAAKIVLALLDEIDRLGLRLTAVRDYREALIAMAEAFRPIETGESLSDRIVAREAALEQARALLTASAEERKQEDSDE